MVLVSVLCAEVFPGTGQHRDDLLGISCSQCSLDVGPLLLAVEDVGSSRALGQSLVHVREVLGGLFSNGENSQVSRSTSQI